VYIRNIIPALALYMGVFVSCIVLAAVPACSSSNKRTNSISASLVAVNAARDGFTSWDRDHQVALVDKATTREESDKALASYHLQRIPVVASFEVAYRALAVAAVGNDEGSLAAAIDAAQKLIEAVKQLRGGI
jgi:hypothetical protein